MEQIKTEEVFHKIYFAKEILDDDIQPTRPKRIRRLPESLGDSIVYEGTGSDLTSNVEDNAIAKQQFKEVIDRILEEMRRFEVKNVSIMKTIQALIPLDNNFFVASDIEPLATHYSIDTEKLAELFIAAKVVVQDGIEKLRERKSSRNTMITAMAIMKW